MKPRNQLISYSLVLFLLLSLFSCTPQQLSVDQNNKVDILEKRVVALEQDKQKALEDLRDEVAEFKTNIATEIANVRKSQQFFIDELNKVRQDQQLIINDNEVAQNNLRKMTTQLEKMNKRLGDQVIALQELRHFFDASLSNVKDDSDQQRTEFENAMSFYKQRQFQKSIDALTSFRQKYPSSKLLDDALYFTSYMYFLQGQYNQASLGFFDLIKQYPGSNRLNDAKWWLGVSLERSGDLNGALDIYRELTRLDKKDPLRIKAEFRLEELTPANPTTKP